jgi:hypothetical protein
VYGLACKLFEAKKERPAAVVVGVSIYKYEYIYFIMWWRACMSQRMHYEW